MQQCWEMQDFGRCLRHKGSASWEVLTEGWMPHSPLPGTELKIPFGKLKDLTISSSPSILTVSVFKAVKNMFPFFIKYSALCLLLWKHKLRYTYIFYFLYEPKIIANLINTPGISSYSHPKKIPMHTHINIKQNKSLKNNDENKVELFSFRYSSVRSKND